MPLVRIDLLEGKSPQYCAKVGKVIYDSMVSALGVPEKDRFQIFNHRSKDDLLFDREYLGIERSDDCIFVQVTLNAGRTVEKKLAFYKAVAEGLHAEVKLRIQDVFISLVEVQKENWSFGNGEAQYASPTP